MEFLHKDNQAGTTLLSLVARGSAIIAELLRLSNNIPSVFKGSPNDPAEAKKYAPVLFDFRYLKSPEAFDEKIDADTELLDLDEEFRENHLALLERFYKLFESIYRYAADFLTYLQELVEGVFIQHTVEGVLLDVEGRQLMCEALYLYGVMLLLLDIRIEGVCRERMIVAYYRHKGTATIPNLDEVVKLCRSTGFVLGGKRPANYPDDYFGRFKLPRAIVDMIIGRLRSDDIYNHQSAYPAPAHRSTALATQCAMLYVVLYFAPDVLHNRDAIMREVVDKHLNDNWVITMYMGFTVDLSEAWAPYKAARTALGNILTKANITDLTNKHAEAVVQLCNELDKFLTEGILIEEFVLQNIRKLMHHVRNCNVTLRWLMLHRTTVHKTFRTLINQAAQTPALLRLMMSTAQFEFVLKSMFKRLLDGKSGKWEQCKQEAAERMNELAAYFGGERDLTRVKKNDTLQAWFRQLADEINSLDFSQSILSGRKLAQLMQALEDVEEFHQISSSLQVKQFLGDTREYLKQMIRTGNVSQKVMGDLEIVSDFSYALDIIHAYVPIMHERIRSRPDVVLFLRATFLKLSSILSLPLVRISQCESKDDVSVAEFYSSQLVAFVRKVLEVIPRSVFKILDESIQLQTTRLKEIPTKLERKYLREFAQLDERYTLARATHQVSVYTQGVLAMKTTLMGIIKVDPRQLLEDGIRKQLVEQIASSLHEFLDFRSGKLGDMEERLTKLGARLDGFKQSFEYIQDYISVYGLKIWQEEFSRIINYNVEQETNSFLKKKVYDWQSSYQSDAIPIPQLPPTPPALANPAVRPSINFTGRLAREILFQTDPRKTNYVESMQGWYDEKQREVVGIRTFSLLHRGVGTFGLTGMDKLLCFMIVQDLSDFVRVYRRTINKQVKDFLHSLTTELSPLSGLPADGPKLYAVAQTKLAKLWALLSEPVARVGQMQLVRRLIANELNFTCKLDSKLLSCALDVMNNALLSDVRAHYSRPEVRTLPDNPILPDIADFLETAGINSPMTKIYITTEPLEGLPVLMFMMVLSQLSKLTWDPVLSTLVCKDKKVALDGPALVCGVATLLKQFHSAHTHSFLAFMAQFVRASIHHAQAGQSNKNAALPAEVSNVLIFLEEFCRFTHTDRSAITALVPAYIFDRFKH